MSFRTDALHMAYGTDRTGRVRECCGNCSDFLDDEYFVVAAHLADGSRVEVHICQDCVNALEAMAQDFDIPFQVDEPETAPAPAEPVAE